MTHIRCSGEKHFPCWEDSKIYTCVHVHACQGKTTTTKYICTRLPQNMPTLKQTNAIVFSRKIVYEFPQVLCKTEGSRLWVAYSGRLKNTLVL